jgi:hypothetical protein
MPTQELNLFQFTACRSRKTIATAASITFDSLSTSRPLPTISDNLQKLSAENIHR